MYLTQKNQIRALSKAEYSALRELCRLSKNLYNVGLYNVRQYFFAERKYLRYESNYHYSKNNENYQMLNTDIAQQTLKVVDRAFRSFFNLIKAKTEGRYEQKIKLPNYLKKDGYFVLIIPARKGRLPIKNGKFILPMSSAFKQKYGKVGIKFPERLKDKTIKEVRIHPQYNARYFEVEYIYEEPPEPQIVNSNRLLGIDLGLNNLATCFSTTGTSFIIDGKRLKSINQWFNKQNAYLQAKKAQQDIKGITARQARLSLARKNKVRDYLNKTARLIINQCIEQQLGKLIVGYNPGFKQESNLGKRNNQNFVQIPFWSLRNKLRSLCERYKIEYQEQEESYTSKASFLERDDIPVFNPAQSCQYNFSGKRIKRGLYRSKDGQIVSADLNGAGNILRKQVGSDWITSESLAGFLANPLRMKIS